MDSFTHKLFLTGRTHDPATTSSIARTAIQNDPPPSNTLLPRLLAYRKHINTEIIIFTFNIFCSYLVCASRPSCKTNQRRANASRPSCKRNQPSLLQKKPRQPSLLRKKPAVGPAKETPPAVPPAEETPPAVPPAKETSRPSCRRNPASRPSCRRNPASRPSCKRKQSITNAIVQVQTPVPIASTIHCVSCSACRSRTRYCCPLLAFQDFRHQPRSWRRPALPPHQFSLSAGNTTNFCLHTLRQGRHRRRRRPSGEINIGDRCEHVFPICAIT